MRPSAMVKPTVREQNAKGTLLLFANQGESLYRFRKELLQCLLAQGWQIEISLPVDAAARKLEALGCRLLNTPMNRRGCNPFGDAVLFVRYLRMLNSRRPALVLTYTVKPNCYGGLACHLTKTPCISTVTGLSSAVAKRGILAKITLFLYRLGLKNVQRVFFHNQYNQKMFQTRKIVGQNSDVVRGSGVNLEEYAYLDYPPNDGCLRLLFAGRILREKGMDELFVCAGKIRAHYHNVSFTLAGECGAGYKNQLVSLEADGVLRYAGEVSDVRPLLETHHAVLLPSYHEGMANILLEAAACGRPILASRIAGCMETLEEGISGISFAPMDAADLCAAVESFIQLPYEEKRRMGLAGRKKMENEFDRRHVVERYKNEIEQIVLGKR